MLDTDKYKNFDDIKCLWMKCGTVDYRICDNNFDCENCDFDKLIISRFNKKVNVNEEIEMVFDSGYYTVPFSPPHFHFGCGLIVKNFIGNNYYLGLEPFMVKFIDKLSSVNYCAKNGDVGKGEPVLNIRNGWGEVNILSPFGFRFIEKLDLKNICSNGVRWFAIIEAEKREVLRNSINEENFYVKLYETKRFLKESLKTSCAAGTTMYDGGKALENWSDILGKSVYKNLMVKLFT